MSNKKVLLSAYACVPFKGSEEGRGWNWAVGLAKMGYEVWCMTNVDGRAKIEAEHAKLGLPNLHFEFVELAFDLDARLFDPSAKSIYLHYYLWKRKGTRRAVALHKAHNFDIAHHITYGSVQQGTCLYKLDNCKIIFGPVGGGQMALPIFETYFENHWKIEVIRGFISKMLVRYSGSLGQTIKKAAHIIATNPETKALLETHKYARLGQCHLSKIYAIPKEYDNLEFIPKEPHQELRIIWIGRLLPRKGLNLSLHALSLVPENIPYSITIVGGGQNKESIGEWMETYNLNPSKVNVLGQIPFTQVAEEYRKADIMLFCSLRDTSGTQIMEAMAYGVPLIVLNISGAINLVPESCAIKIDPVTAEQTVQDIANAVTLFQTNPKLRNEKALNAYNHAMNSKWERRIAYFTSEYYEK